MLLVSMCAVLLRRTAAEKKEEGEGRPSCLESERRERRHREAGRERRGPVRVVGRRRRLAAGIAGVQGQDVVVVQVVRERRCIDRRAHHEDVTRKCIVVAAVPREPDKIHPWWILESDAHIHVDAELNQDSSGRRVEHAETVAFCQSS